jgi:hypothetical protein
MNARRIDADDHRNTAFGPGSPEMVEHRPGFLDEPGKQRDAKGEEHFPRKSKQGDVPRESLASRLAKLGKGA